MKDSGHGSKGNGIISVMLAAAFSTAPVCALPDERTAEISGAINSYLKGDFAAARPVLEGAVRNNPYGQEAHYYLGCTLLSLKQCKQATREFQASFELDPLNAFGQNSRTALLSMKAPLYSQQSVSAKLAPDDPKSIVQAVSLIGNQTTDRNRLNKTSGTAYATIASANAQTQESVIQRFTSALVEDLQSANKGGQFNQEIEELKQRAAFQTQRARHDAREQATRHMKAAAERSTMIEKSAGNLLALISEDPHPGRIKLKAAGTNLYVRNYCFEPEPPPVPLRAEWQALPQAALPNGARSRNPNQTVPAGKTSTKSVNSGTRKKARFATPAGTAAESSAHVKEEVFGKVLNL